MVDRQKNPKMSMIPDQILTNFSGNYPAIIIPALKSQESIVLESNLIFYFQDMFIHCPGKRGDKNGKKKLKKGKNISGCLSVGNGLTAELTAGLRLYH